MTDETPAPIACAPETGEPGVGPKPPEKKGVKKNGAKPGERRGGRSKGTKNKRTLLSKELVEKVCREGETPLEYFMRIMRDKKQPDDRRDWAAKEAAKYIHPTISSVSMTNEGDKPLELKHTIDFRGLSAAERNLVRGLLGKATR